MKDDIKLEVNLDLSGFNREFRKARLALEQFGIAIGDSLLPVFEDASAEFAKIGVRYLERFAEEIVIYRWPLWFVYLILGGSLVLITLVLGI